MGKAERKKSERMDMTGFGFVSNNDGKCSAYGILTSLRDDNSFELAFGKAFPG